MRELTIRVSRALAARPLMLLATVAALFQAVDMLLVVAVDALFLRRIGPAYLPHAYVLVNAGAVVLVALLLTGRSVSTFRLSLRMTVALAATAALSVPFLKGTSFALFFAIFLIVRLHDKLCFSYFLTFVQGVFPVRESKQKLSIILGVSSAVCVVAGLSVRPLVVHVSMEALFVLAAVLAAALVALMKLCATVWPAGSGAVPADPEPAGSGPGEPAAAGSRLGQALGLLKTSALARNVAAAFLLSMLLRYLIEFQFSRTITTLYPDDVTLASFVGAFKSSIALTFTLGQLFLTSRLLVGLHPGGTMTIVPLVLLGLAAVTVALPEATPILLMQGAWNVGFHVCMRPAFGILTAPLDAATRDRVGLLASLADSAGSTAAGLLLLVASDAVGLRAFFVGVAGLCAMGIAVSRRLDGDYVHALEHSVSGADGAAKIDSMHALEYLSSTSIRDHLERLLVDGEPGVRIEATQKIAALGPRLAEPLVEKVLREERDVRVLAALVRVLPDVLGPRMLPMLRDLASRVHDERMAANLIEALGQLGTPADAEAIGAQLCHPSTRVRVAAILSVVRLAHEREPLDRALTTLAGMLTSVDPGERAAAVVVLGQTRRPVFARAAVACLSDPSGPVRRSAIRAVEKLRPAGALARLREIAASDPLEELRQAAAAVCRSIEDTKVDELARLMSRLTPKERSNIGAFLRSERDAPRLAVLERLLRMNLPVLPVGVLDVVRLVDDRPTLVAAARSVDPEHPSLSPLADLVEDGGSDEGQTLQLLAALGRTLGPSAGTAVLAERLDVLHGLNLARQGPGKAPDDPCAAQVDGLWRRLLERLLVLIATLDGGDDRESLIRALEAAVGPDRHLASMSIDLLESRLVPDVFALVGPLLENHDRTEALVAISTRPWRFMAMTGYILICTVGGAVEQDRGCSPRRLVRRKSWVLRRAGRPCRRRGFPVRSRRPS